MSPIIRTLLCAALAAAFSSPLLADADAPAADTNMDTEVLMGLDVADSAAADDTLVSEVSDQATSPMRITLAHEASYKVEQPESLVKNRTSARLEYSQYVREKFFVQLDAKGSVFWGADHRHDAEGTDLTLSQAYVQSSFRQTSIKAGYQVLPWGESIIAPVTDVVSPRDQRELFNFNLDELRLGQAMVAVDQYSEYGQWSGFFIPHAEFNENPLPGTAYFFDPLRYSTEIGGEDDLSEYGGSWRKTFSDADITVMAANLIANDYALRLGTDGRVTRERERFSLAGAVFNYAMKQVIFRGEVAWKSDQAFNDAALQIVKRDVIDAYFGAEYSPSSTLTVSLEGVNRHVMDWSYEVASAPKDSQSLLLSVTKMLLHDDLTINFLNFHSMPQSGSLAMLLTTYDLSDNMRLGVNVVYPYSQDEDSALFAVRDQKQIVFKIQYQF
jgi:hypothetical protein